ncbi:MAG: FMN-binding negative transcriptional regulator [Pseudomonadales bacterium]
MIRYNPPAFRVEDPARLTRVIEAYPFAMLVSGSGDGIEASHLPCLFRPDAEGAGSGTLRAHLARANPHWQSLDGAQVLVIFQGPAHYVSPGWYPTKRENPAVVPTWNYVVVHARGRARVFHDVEPLRALVSDLTDHMESGRSVAGAFGDGDPWCVDDAPDDYVRRLLAQIVGIEIRVESLAGKFKLSQNRSAADQAGVRAGLAARDPQLLDAIERLKR